MNINSNLESELEFVTNKKRRRICDSDQIEKVEGKRWMDPFSNLKTRNTSAVTRRVDNDDQVGSTSLKEFFCRSKIEATPQMLTFDSPHNWNSQEENRILNDSMRGGDFIDNMEIAPERSQEDFKQKEALEYPYSEFLIFPDMNLAPRVSF